MALLRTVFYIEAFDHYSSQCSPSERGKEVISTIIGELVEETEHYLTLRSFNQDADDSDGFEETHSVLKAAIRTQIQLIPVEGV